MKKKDVFKLGYNYAIDCGSERCTKSVLNPSSRWYDI